jgi:hypothetical protein
MKKNKESMKDELREVYGRSDFPGGFVRGKYADRLRESSNVVVLKPEVAAVFPNAQAVNGALQSLIDIAQRAPGRTKGPTSRTRKQRTS